MLFGCCLPGGPYDAQRAQRLAQAGFDYAEIAAAPLRGAGYDGTVSIECGWTEFETEMIRGLAFLCAHF